MEFKDYYKIMGVARGATEAEIKQAYRKLARKYHPDVSKEKDAEARFKELGEAYEVLRNPEKRAAYDQLGTGHRPGEQFRPPPDWGAGFEFSGAGDTGYSDFFEALFGRAARAGRGRRGFAGGRGEDHHAKVLLDLEATLSGGTRSIGLRVPEVDAEGRLQVSERTLNVQIPKGILPGQTIRLAGQGTRVHGGEAGDLYVEVEFAPHRLYRVDGRDLLIVLPVAPWEAALGAEITVPTLDGKVNIKIPAGTSSGQKLRVRGRGLGKEGDLIVALKIVVPAKLTDAQKKLWEHLAHESKFNPRD